MLPVLASLIAAMSAVDLAYQLRVGASILAGGGIPSSDAWTFTVPGRPWLDQQWGAQVILATVFQVAGWTGLAVLRAALVGLTFGVLARMLRGLGLPVRDASLLSLLSFVVAAPALALRPQLFGVVLFAITLAILVGRARHPRRLWLIPVIVAAWANLHGSFPLGLVLVGIFWLDSVARSRSIGGREPVGLATIGAVALAATLVNPLGVDVWRYVLQLTRDPTVSTLVSEWRPPSPLDPAGAIFYASLVAVVVGVAHRLRTDRWRLRAAAVAPLAGLLLFGILGVLTGRG